MLKKLLGLVAAAYLLGACASEEAPPPPPPPPPAPQNFMVFFDWDSTKLSDASLNVLEQARDAFKNKQDARITSTGHTDTSGSAAYNMALSLRRSSWVSRLPPSPRSARARPTCSSRRRTVSASRRTAASRSRLPAWSLRPTTWPTAAR